MEKVEGQSAQDQNVGRKHQRGVELPWSIPLSGAGEALCISTTHEDADIIDQQEVRHVLEPVEEIDEDAKEDLLKEIVPEAYAHDLPPKDWSSNRLVNWTC